MLISENFFKFSRQLLVYICSEIEGICGSHYIHKYIPKFKKTCGAWDQGKNGDLRICRKFVERVRMRRDFRTFAAISVLPQVKLKTRSLASNLEYWPPGTAQAQLSLFINKVSFFFIWFYVSYYRALGPYLYSSPCNWTESK